MKSIFANVPKEIARHMIQKHVAICERFEKLFGGQGGYSRTTLLMDLEAVPDWDLDILLASADGDFGHDVAGLMSYMDRSTFPGVLSGWFAPRCGCLA